MNEPRKLKRCKFCGINTYMPLWQHYLTECGGEMKDDDEGAGVE